MKNNKGITIITLIITILVMLILVVITMNLTIREDGVISKTDDAKTAQDIATEMENIQLAISAVKIKGKENDVVEFEKEIEAASKKEVNVSEQNEVTFVDSQRTYSVDMGKGSIILLDNNNPAEPEDNIAIVEPENLADWKYVEVDGKVKIIQYLGSNTEIVIPNYIEGKPVTQIGYEAYENSPKAHLFVNSASITKVIISEGIEIIGDRAFSECMALKSVTIPNSVTSIGQGVFGACMALENITIPGGVSTIPLQTFMMCSKLESVTLLDGIESLGDRAFYSCGALKSIIIPDSVTSVGANVFTSCSKLESVTLSKGMTNIGRYMFTSCTSLKNITIPDNITSINDYAFAGCSSLESINIPETVTSIGRYAFTECTSLSEVKFPEKFFNCSIGDYAFSKCTGLTEVACFANSLSRQAFSNCTNLTKISYFDSNVQYIRCFKDCPAVNDLTVYMSYEATESVKDKGKQYLDGGIGNMDWPSEQFKNMVVRIKPFSAIK